MAEPHANGAFRLAANRWFTATWDAERLQVGEDVLRFAAVGEALFWAMALDDTLEHAGRRDDLCLGLRFARNRASHDLLRTVNDKPGAILPVILPFRFFHYVWRDAVDLPIPASGQGSGRHGHAQRQAYERGWEGQLVDRTFRDLSRHFGIELIC